MEKIKILCIGGSLEAASRTNAAMKFAAASAAELGAKTNIVDLRECRLPIYDPSKGLEQGGSELKNFLEEVVLADGYIFASPEYHGTISGAFKNLLDYLEFLAEYEPPYLARKPAGAIAIGGGEISGAITVQTIVHIIHSFRGLCVSGNAAINSSQLELEGGKIVSETVKRRIRRLVLEVFELAVKLRR
jgi:FMN reductase